MKIIQKTAIGFVLATILFGCEKKESEKKGDFSALTKSYFDDKNKLSPLDATFNGQNQFNAELQLEMTESFRTDQKRLLEKYETALQQIDTSDLNAEEKISYEIIKWELEIGREQTKFPTHLMPVNQFWGTYLTMGQLASGQSAQPFRTVKDYENFHSRMEKYSVWLDSAMVNMRKGIAQKVVLPKALTLKTIPQFENMISASVEENLFYSTIKTLPDDFSQADKNRLADAYAKTINEKLLPKFREMVSFLKTDYLAASRTSSGINAFEFGPELYQHHIKQWTTTLMTADEIHNLGLSEVARITAEMEKVKTQTGFKGTIREFFDHVRSKKELMPFKSAEEVIANFKAIHARIKPNVDKLFSLQPKMPFEVRRTESFREKSASAEYSQGAVDGSRPGIFYVPIPNVATYNYYADEDLFLHEAIPGHHFQIALQQENKDLPDFRKYNWFGAEGEGWALYTESLGKELGLYTDPYQYFGMLSSEMHRAIRLVVDTGIHSKGWSREKAIQYSLENEAESEEGITAEIERYMAIPGQALSYKIGQLKIIELRKRAETQLGDKFDIKQFHTQILESGLMPLALLEKKIDGWIKRTL